MAKFFDGANRYILFIQVSALLVSVCFASLLLQLSENPQRPLKRRSPLKRSSPEGNSVSNTVGESEGRSKCTLFVMGSVSILGAV